MGLLFAGLAPLPTDLIELFLEISCARFDSGTSTILIPFGVGIYFLTIFTGCCCGCCLEERLVLEYEFFIVFGGAMWLTYV